MTYNEIEYWSKRKNPSSKKAVTEPHRHINYIKNQLSGCNKILDFGPGVGRTFSAYEYVEIVEGFDITDLRVEELYNEASQHDFTFSLTVEPVIGKLPYADKEFDAAIASEVFLHQRPENIIKVMVELIRVADKVVVISWQDKNKPQLANSGKHCFNYYYADLCEENNWKIYNVVETDAKTIYFCYEDKFKKEKE